MMKIPNAFFNEQLNIECDIDEFSSSLVTSKMFSRLPFITEDMQWHIMSTGP